MGFYSAIIEKKLFFSSRRAVHPNGLRIFDIKLKIEYNYGIETSMIHSECNPE